MSKNLIMPTAHIRRWSIKVIKIYKSHSLPLMLFSAFLMLGLHMQPLPSATWTLRRACSSNCMWTDIETSDQSTPAVFPEGAGRHLCLDLSGLPRVCENRWRRNIYQALKYMEQTTAVPLVCIELSIAEASCVLPMGECFQNSCRLGSCEDVSLGSISTATGCPRSFGIVTGWASTCQTLLARASSRWWCWNQASWQKECVFSKIRHLLFCYRN